MSFIEIRSSFYGNASISSNHLIVDTSDYIAAGKEKFETSIFIDAVKDEIIKHGLELPTKYQLAPTNNYAIKIDSLRSANFVSKNGLSIYHYPQQNSIRKMQCGHQSTGWIAEIGTDSVAYFCDNVFLNDTDLRFLMYAFEKRTQNQASTKDKCLGFSLSGIGAISVTYKKPWDEITPSFLDQVSF